MRYTAIRQSFTAPLPHNKQQFLRRLNLILYICTNIWKRLYGSKTSLSAPQPNQRPGRPKNSRTGWITSIKYGTPPVYYWRGFLKSGSLWRQPGCCWINYCPSLCLQYSLWSVGMGCGSPGLRPQNTYRQKRCFSYQPEIQGHQRISKTIRKWIRCIWCRAFIHIHFCCIGHGHRSATKGWTGTEDCCHHRRWFAHGRPGLRGSEQRRNRKYRYTGDPEWQQHVYRSQCWCHERIPARHHHFQNLQQSKRGCMEFPGPHEQIGTRCPPVCPESWKCPQIYAPETVESFWVTEFQVFRAGGWAWPNSPDQSFTGPERYKRTEITSRNHQERKRISPGWAEPDSLPFAREIRQNHRWASEG